MGMLRALWRYRRFVLGMVVRDLRARYMGSLLGGVWAVLSPLLMLAVYLLVFSAVMRGRIPGVTDGTGYALFLCTGILCWNYFTEVLTRCSTVFLENASLLKKMSFPRTTLPAFVLTSATVHFAITAVLFLAFLALTHRFPVQSCVALIPLLAIQQGFAIGLGILLGTLNVFFRDVGQFLPVGLNLWFWSTPVVYHVDILPEEVKPLIEMNPLVPLYQALQQVVVADAWPVWAELKAPVLAALAALIAGFIVFRALTGQIVDEL